MTLFAELRLGEGSIEIDNLQAETSAQEPPLPSPSKGMSEAKVEQQSTETLSFRCWCERCRLTRGRRVKQSRATKLGSGDGSTFNSATVKQLQKLNNVTCNTEIISESSSHQAVTAHENRQKLPLPTGEGWGEGSTFNSTTGKQLQEPNNKTDLRSVKQKRAAFTLAEVLITLGIIGIVAAMTLPSLITNYREKQRVSQLKKTYSTLQQAFLRAEEAHGEYQYWDLTNTNTSGVDENGDYILDHSGDEKVMSYLGEFLNATKSNSDLKITTYKLDGTLLNKDYVVSQSRYLKLNDGTILVMGWVSKDNTDVQVLFQGCERKGCRVGVDLFYFTLQPKVGFKPLGLPISGSNFLFENTCNLGKTVSTNGRGCTAWVIYKENMDYLHCNDLSWNGKSKCGK